MALRASGRYEIYTLSQTGSPAQPWSCHGPISMDGGILHPLARGAFVVDSKSGIEWPASRSRLAAVDMSSGPRTPSILVMTGAKGARCFANLDGERVGKAEWGSKIGTIQCVQIVEKLGES